MQEQHITVAGARHDLPKPFHVLATQNPLEQEGTYPLPEAQLDRFLMEIDVDYPDRDAERRILFETTGADETLAKASMDAEILIAAQRLVRRLPVGDSVVEAILSLVRAARPSADDGGDKLIAWGLARAPSQSLMLAVRARALLDGRLAPSIDDVLDLAEPILKHRMALTFSARGRPHHSRRNQTIEDADRLMAAETSHETRRFWQYDVPMAKPNARRIAAPSRARSPPHRRQRHPWPAWQAPRRAGESFWQYRRFVSGEPSQNVDWRRSARDDHLYVREQEWEAAHTVGFGPTARPRWRLLPGARATASWSAG